MARSRIPEDAQEQVLVLARRRCCICFGLHRDTRIKAGQLAHLDRNPANHKPDNLAFICLEHHDQYDSSTSQSKRLTPQEVRRYRRELHEAIDREWKLPVSFSAGEVQPSDPFSGHWIRETDFESAELSIRMVSPGRVQVRGLALWGTTLECGPNLGILDFEATIEHDAIHFSDGVDNRAYRLSLELSDGELTAREENVVGYFGANVSFEGAYDRVKGAA